eukprot:CAMPEP_0170505722 /NCGR_PEP_ID=MMETSP0208-20121228/52028_1 /TAXON_ID=197538 /ORGANISM="Strombidium inclinatum, Strain S3" /LENGTH=41 /DNA_ID= /DNA_START= /DNA_END= /DNA_ORIENTATION=
MRFELNGAYQLELGEQLVVDFEGADPGELLEHSILEAKDDR